MVTHPKLQNASLRVRYLLNRFVEDWPHASPGALLKDNLGHESSLLATFLVLATPLVELFATEQTPSA